MLPSASKPSKPCISVKTARPASTAPASWAAT